MAGRKRGRNTLTQKLLGRRKRGLQIIAEKPAEGEHVRKLQQHGFVVKQIVGIGKRRRTTPEQPGAPARQPSMNQLISWLFEPKPEVIETAKDVETLEEASVILDEHAAAGPAPGAERGELPAEREAERKRFFALLGARLRQANRKGTQEAETAAAVSRSGKSMAALAHSSLASTAPGAQPLLMSVLFSPDADMEEISQEAFSPQRAPVESYKKRSLFSRILELVPRRASESSMSSTRGRMLAQLKEVHLGREDAGDRFH